MVRDKVLRGSVIHIAFIVDAQALPIFIEFAPMDALVISDPKQNI